MNNGWNVLPLSQCLSKVIDYRGKTPKKLGSNWVESGYKAISANNVKFNGLDKLESINFADQELYNKWMKEEVKQGDLLLTSEAPSGQIMLWDTDEKIVLSQRVFALRVNELIYNKYLKYYIQSSNGQKEILRNNSGSTVAGISAKTFSNILVRYPKKQTQHLIGDLLYALDKKIELNSQINIELESMAKTLYDYWFVQFDFPDKNGKPYKSSGGKMVYNSVLKSEIPEDWDSANISKIAILFGGGTPKKSNKEYWNGNIPFFTPTDCNSSVYTFETAENITEQGLNNSSTKLFSKNTLFITARGSVGRLALNGTPMAMNQSCYALQAKEGISYTYLFFLTKLLIHHLEVKASGSVFNSIVSNDIYNTYLAIPNSCELITEYAIIAEPLFKKIEINIEEIRKLSMLRDFLIPMLMNGQVTIKE